MQRRTVAARSSSAKWTRGLAAECGQAPLALLNSEFEMTIARRPGHVGGHFDAGIFQRERSARGLRPIPIEMEPDFVGPEACFIQPGAINHRGLGKAGKIIVSSAAGVAGGKPVDDLEDGFVFGPHDLGNAFFQVVETEPSSTLQGSTVSWLKTSPGCSASIIATGLAGTRRPSS